MKQLPFQCGRSKVAQLSRTRVTAIYVVCVLTILGAFVDVRAKNCSSNPAEHQFGWTEPEGDVFLQTGKSLEIYCMLNEEYHLTRYNANDLVFYRNNDEKIEDINVRPFNRTTNRLLIENVTESEDWYRCKLKVSPDQEELVCSNFVAVGSQPQNVTNFTCYSMNWEVLSCSWIVADNFVPTKYTLSYSLEEQGDSGVYSCPNNTDRPNNSCEWTMHSVPSYRRTHRNYTMHIVGRNSLGTSSQDIPVDTFERIKLNPPQDLKCINMTTSSTYLSWKIGNLRMYNESILYKVQYAEQSRKNWYNDTICGYSKQMLSVSGNGTLDSHPCRNGTILLEEGEMFLNVTGLPYPGRQYHFNVSIKVELAPEEHWSQPATIVC